MSKSLRISLLVAIILTLTKAGGQEPDRHDTLRTRSDSIILIPRWDTIKQLDEINLKADTILSDLKEIKLKLGIIKKDTIK